MPALIDKVRVFCHELKMDALAGVDPDLELDLRSRIKALPSPEAMSKMGHTDLQELATRCERLVFDLDNARNGRTKSFALRHRIQKGIPPRLEGILDDLTSTWYRRAKGRG
jgi:uncharacterized protein with von Willebrand factor type A (vWA) domain